MGILSDSDSASRKGAQESLFLSVPGGVVAGRPHSAHWGLRIRKAAVSHSPPGAGTCQKCNCQLSLCAYQTRSLGGSAVFEQALQVVLLLHAHVWEPLLCSRMQPSVTLYPRWAGSWTLRSPNVNEPSPLGHQGFIKKRLWFSFSNLAIKSTLFLHDPWMVINPTHYALFKHWASQSTYNKGAECSPGSCRSLTACDPTALQLERLWRCLCLCPWTPLSPPDILLRYPV